MINRLYQIAVSFLMVCALIGCEPIHVDDPLSVQERKWLAQHDGAIAMAIETGYAPFAFIDENGKSSGLATEYIELIEKRLNFSIKKTPYDSIDKILTAAKGRQIDIVNAVTETQERKRYLLFSRPFIEIPNVIIMRKDNPDHLSIDEMSGIKISLVKNYAITEYLSQKYSDLDIDLVPDDLTALLSVSFNRTDSTIIDLATASYYIEQKGITNLRIAGDAGYNIKLAIGSRKDWPILHSIIEKGLSSISPEERKSINSRWFSLGVENGFHYKQARVVIITVFSGLLIVISAIFIWNRLLKRQVEQHTMQLKVELVERKKAEQALRKSEEKYRRIFENSVVGFFQSTPKGRFVTVNSAFADMLGYRSAEEMVTVISDIATQYYADPRDRRRYQQVLESQGYVENFEFEALKKDGTRLWVSNSARLVLSEEDEIWGYEGVVIEIGGRKKAEAERQKMHAQLLQAQKMESVGRLAGGVAHDFNNMLGVILGYTEMALDEVSPNQSLYAGLLEIQKAARRSADITRQLLAFARKQTIAPRVLDLNETVEGMLKMLRRLIGEDIDLVWQPATHLWPVKMDPSQVDQILANLCVNARDAIGGVGRIVIQTGQATFAAADCADHPDLVPGDFVLLAISDNGCGMDAQTLDNLFEPFFTTKDIDKGTGLGLATVYGIVKQNDGFITVDSTPGHGTTFKIFLARHQGTTAPGRKANPAVSEAGGNETILVAEDEPTILNITTMMLQRLGYQVVAATNPEMAIKIAAEYAGRIHLLMTDVVMPAMNGRDLAARLREKDPELRVLYMSGYTADVIAHSGVLDNGTDFIQKPFSKQELAVKVREVLGGADGADAP